MYVGTMGTCPYKLKMVELLDPKKMYFSSRVIAQEDWTQKNKKRLDVIPGKESAILILDDKEKVLQLTLPPLITKLRFLFCTPPLMIPMKLYSFLYYHAHILCW